MPAAQTRPITNTSAGDLSGPTIDGEFEIGRAELAIRCYGKGSPAIVIEAGMAEARPARATRHARGET